jgi:hypothetical protein
MSSWLKTGRPPVINKVIVQKLEVAFRDGFSVAKACTLSGISRSTYYEHLKRNADFSDKMVLAQAWVTELAKQVVVAEIKAGNLPAAKWWLERKAKEEFGPNAAIVVSTSPTGGLEVIHDSITVMRKMVDKMERDHDAAAAMAPLNENNVEAADYTQPISSNEIMADLVDYGR